MSRICAEVQAQLPTYVDGSLRRWRRRLVALHLRRCDACRDELGRQEEVHAGLDALAAPRGTAEPPDALLDALLAQAEEPGLRGRVAVPARGAVSGARPALSAALLLGGAAAGTAVGYAGWKAARRLTRRAGRGG